MHLGEPDTKKMFPEVNLNIIQDLRYYVVENARTARRFIKSTGYEGPIHDIHIFEIDKHAPDVTAEKYMKPLLEGHDMGLLSEAGVPGVADPGAILVNWAHRHQIRVVPLVGPSSILMALMASGLNGQKFRFHGYLPVQQSLRIHALRNMEKVSMKESETQIFMETPYRNRNLLADILNTCHPGSLLCIATDITLQTESILTQSIAAWKQNPPDIHKRPTIFLIQGHAR
jgi:16S rRNA (cytidine1402-2'-O)-methyltransferase